MTMILSDVKLEAERRLAQRRHNGFTRAAIFHANEIERRKKERRQQINKWMERFDYVRYQ